MSRPDWQDDDEGSFLSAVHEGLGLLIGVLLLLGAVACGYVWLTLAGDRSECRSGLAVALAAQDCARVATISDWTAAGALACTVVAVLVIRSARR